MKRICVFCGASEGGRPAYADAARRFGAELVARGLGLVYGGCAVGMMGILADTVLACGGEGVRPIPQRPVSREPPPTGLAPPGRLRGQHRRNDARGPPVAG